MTVAHPSDSVFVAANVESGWFAVCRSHIPYQLLTRYRRLGSRFSAIHMHQSDVFLR